MEEPLTPMRESAAAAYELFLSYVAAGFTEDQAIRIIVLATIEGGKQPDEEPKDG